MSLLPKSARKKADPLRYAIKNFLMEAASGLPEGSSVLDAGAGNRRYEHFFTRQSYIAADFCKVADKNYKKMDVVTDLTEMGLRDGCVDAVINIQVLEHVPDPLKLITELARVLKPGGSLFLSCPLNWGVHEAPYDFYRFTSFALDSLFCKAGLEVVYIRPMGGYFHTLAKIISRLPFQLEKPRGGGFTRLLYKARHAVLKEVFHYWVPYLVMHLDFLDRKKDFTLGWLCRVRKP